MSTSISISSSYPARLYFMIITKDDFPIYEFDIASTFQTSSSSSSSSSPSTSSSSSDELLSFILHASLDTLDARQWLPFSASSSSSSSSSSYCGMFFRSIDKFPIGDSLPSSSSSSSSSTVSPPVISAFLTLSHHRFLLLHDSRLDDLSVRNYFVECYELMIKYHMNPFYEKNTKMEGRKLDEKVRNIAEKYLVK